MGGNTGPPENGEWWDFPYNRASNWDGNSVPRVGDGEAALIGNGDLVVVSLRYYGHFVVDKGGEIEIDGGSELNLSLALQGSGPIINTIKDGEVTLRNGALFSMPDSYLGVGSASQSLATLTVAGQSEVNIGSTLIMGSPSGPSISTININDGRIIARGVPFEPFYQGGMVLQGYGSPDNTLRINFSGPSGSYIELCSKDQDVSSDHRILLISNEHSTITYATWSDLWDAGILTAEGRSGLTGDVFDDYFTAIYTNNDNDSGRYILTYSPVPEPSTVVLLMLAGLGMARRRRQQDARAKKSKFIFVQKIISTDHRMPVPSSTRLRPILARNSLINYYSHFQKTA